ncbi:hypothetical protein BH10BAC5_BH10BAC5_20360 [soil metagenome]
MAKRIIDLYRILSIDVCIGVCCMTFYFVKIFHSHAAFVNYLLIFLTVFGVYSTDHLIDAYLLKKEASTIRHRFFQKYFLSLCLITILVIVSVLILSIRFLSSDILKAGVILAALVIMYCIINFIAFRKRMKNYLKEMISSIIYTSGLLISSGALLTESKISVIIVNFLIIFLIVYLNLIIFSYFDYENDNSDGYSSAATIIGKKGTLRLIYIIAASCAVIIILKIFYSGFDIPDTLIPLSMLLTLFLIIYLREYFKINFRYRYAGDSIFLFPIILLLL